MTWPLHDLELRAPDVLLRGMTETWAMQLADVTPADLEHHPRLAHFSSGTDVLQSYWRNNGLWLPTDWVAEFVVLHDGAPIGLQALEGKDFATDRTVDTHSWLVPAARRRGFGKQMRAAALTLAFDHLGATSAITEAWSDNKASLGVSQSLGYVEGRTESHPGGRVMQHMRLTSWTSPWPVEALGVEPCLPFFGL